MFLIHLEVFFVCMYITTVVSMTAIGIFAYHWKPRMFLTVPIVPLVLLYFLYETLTKDTTPLDRFLAWANQK